MRVHLVKTLFFSPLGKYARKIIFVNGQLRLYSEICCLPLCIYDGWWCL